MGGSTDVLMKPAAPVGSEDTYTYRWWAELVGVVAFKDDTVCRQRVQRWRLYFSAVEAYIVVPCVINFGNI